MSRIRDGGPQRVKEALDILDSTFTLFPSSIIIFAGDFIMVFVVGHLCVIAHQMSRVLY